MFTNKDLHNYYEGKFCKNKSYKLFLKLINNYKFKQHVTVSFFSKIFIISLLCYLLSFSFDLEDISNTQDHA